MMPSKKDSFFYSSSGEPNILLPLSTLDIKDHTFNDVLTLEKAVMQVGRGSMDMQFGYCDKEAYYDKHWLEMDIERSRGALIRFRSLINGPSNQQGELYQYWFNLPKVNIFTGNNFLLTAVSRACHALSDEHKSHVETMVHELLSDAQQKLSSDYFKCFIAFRYKSLPTKKMPTDYYFDNTPLTLAILTGMHTVAERLLKTGLLLPKDIDTQVGMGYVILDGSEQVVKKNPGSLSAAHLTALRLNITREKRDLSLLMLLRKYSANFNLVDEHQYTVRDLFRLRIPQYTAGCAERYNDVNSDFAHRLNYDSNLTDVYTQKDYYNPYAKEIERHPGIFQAHPSVVLSEIMGVFEEAQPSSKNDVVLLNKPRIIP